MKDSSNPWLISIVGPTAVGKTEMSIRLARWLKSEIVSADSRQFYIEMNIGTAKPDAKNLLSVLHHFINSHSVKNHFSAGEYGRVAVSKIEELHVKNNVAIATGGSGLYLKALWEGFDEIPEVDSQVRKDLNEAYEIHGLKELLKELQQKDPVYYDQVDKQNHRRVIRALEVVRGTGYPFSSVRIKKTMKMPYSQLKIGLNMEHEKLYSKINQRMDQMIEEGLFEEAEKLYPYKNLNALQTVGYSEIFNFMDRKYDKEEAIRLLKRNSRRYAKRQLTFFRKYKDIHWFKPNQEKEIRELIKQTLL